MEQPPVLDSAVINELREIMGGDFDTLVASYIRDGGQRLQALHDALAAGDAGGRLKATAVKKVLEELDPAALAWALRHRKRRIYPLLLATGASIPSHAEDAYLRKVAAAGGFPAYEKAHRQALATKFAAKALPRLPTDVAAQVVAFAFHVGYY